MGREGSILCLQCLLFQETLHLPYIIHNILYIIYPVCLLKFNIHNWLCTLNSNLIHICSVTMVRDCAIMGAIPYMGFSAFAIETTQDKVLACASTKFTLATVVVGGVWKSQHFTNNIGVCNVPRTRCVITTISVAERSTLVEDLSPIGARLQRYKVGTLKVARHCITIDFPPRVWAFDKTHLGAFVPGPEKASGDRGREVSTFLGVGCGVPFSWDVMSGVVDRIFYNAS